jgi:hypothetical protein
MRQNGDLVELSFFYSMLTHYLGIVYEFVSIRIQTFGNHNQSFLKKEASFIPMHKCMTRRDKL